MGLHSRRSPGALTRATGTATGRFAIRERLRVTPRGIQIALGAIWLLDGLLQFQSYMYTHAFITETLAPAIAGQGAIVAGPMRTFQTFYGHDLTLWNTISAEVQCAIGLGLIVSRRTVRCALLVSFGWALTVWWFGEGFGGLTSNTLPSALSGAPGGAIMYAIIGLLVWPTSSPPTRSAADVGPLGDRGGQIAWSALWLLSAVLWVVNVNRAKNATHDMIASMASSSPHWLANWQSWAATHTRGHGVTIAIVLAVVSAVIAGAAWTPLRRPALAVGIVLSLAYWVFGQSLGGPFWIGNQTDVDAGPLFVLLALTVWPAGRRSPVTRRAASAEAQIGAPVAA